MRCTKCNVIIPEDLQTLNALRQWMRFGKIILFDEPMAQDHLGLSSLAKLPLTMSNVLLKGASIDNHQHKGTS